MSTSNEEVNQSQPVVLIHRLPVFSTSFLDRVKTQFTFLDPLLQSAESTHSFITRHASSVRAVLCVGPSPLTSETLSLLPALEIVVNSSAGVDHIDLQECRRRGVRVTNAGHAFSEDVADYAVALLIDVLRRISGGDRFIRAGLWEKNRDYPLGSKVRFCCLLPTWNFHVSVQVDWLDLYRKFCPNFRSKDFNMIQQYD